ncbi:SAM-dependent methyltransferase [Desulfobaculum xiamenense]|uniref:SAM-dependent methyltransferase n=1 Tax=Desulfobaculum xiamenense TaxID=995050 RepID=A0A846QDQ1_9BACT|nr:methyltransferase domain-containing protein [Desulfobaculum xiamenense]NJB66856.1 SAM-dependent methyltransferase [Desulfobaculum xiamenense]
MKARRMRSVLHVGCGMPKPDRLHAMFRTPGWREIRLDINPDVRPDYVASITDMRIVVTSSMDAIYSSHNLEHLYPHEVSLALSEFRRVLRADGFALVTVPDVQSVAEAILRDGLDDALYNSSLGPVAPLDILYGHRVALAQGRLYMAHHTGFTQKTLAVALQSAGFTHVEVRRDPQTYSIWAKATVNRPASTAKASHAGAEEAPTP